MIVFARTGYDLEREFCGCACVDVDRRFRCGRVHNLIQAMRLVKNYQSRLGWNPKRPKTALSRCLFRRIASRLRNGGADLRLFISVGTRLDLMGIDCWFEYCHRFATIDLTVRNDKVTSGADFIVTRQHFLDNQHYQIADDIAQKLARM